MFAKICATKNMHLIFLNNWINSTLGFDLIISELPSNVRGQDQKVSK